MNQLDVFFNRCTVAVDEALDLLIPSADTAPARLNEAVRWSVFAGGKRFRPALVLAVGEAFGASEESLIRTAAAIEMVHTYSLIHDDLPAMDDDDLRRGRATCHIKFDEATAILAGDILQSLAFKAVAGDDKLPTDARLRIVGELAEAAAKMVDGQQLDLDGEGQTVSLDELENIHRNKTGAMIVVSARSGAIVAGAKDDELSSVSEYAAKLGLLFQITDDLLDVSQTTETLGKTAGKDAVAEKATYPAILGFDNAARLARDVRDEAVGALAGLTCSTEILELLADFILNRRK